MDRRNRRQSQVSRPCAELGVLALALGTAASLNRLFIGWTFLGSLAIPVIGSWLTALAMRRLRVPVLAALAFVDPRRHRVLTLQFAPGTSMVGLPTGRRSMPFVPTSTSRSGGSTGSSPPSDATDGFLVVIAAVLWLFGFFADTAAFRYSSPVQAAVPYAAAFVAIGILARRVRPDRRRLFFLVGLATTPSPNARSGRPSSAGSGPRRARARPPSRAAAGGLASRPS